VPILEDQAFSIEIGKAALRVVSLPSPVEWFYVDDLAVEAPYAAHAEAQPAEVAQLRSIQSGGIIMLLTSTSEGRSSVQSEAYLDLLAGVLSRTVIPEYYCPLGKPTKPIYRWLYQAIRGTLRKKNLDLVRHYKMDPNKRLSGEDSPPDAETMIGLKRLRNLRECVRIVIEDEVPGDLIETGVWRGGACILMRGALLAYGDQSRCVWVADSFQGLPKPNAEKYPADSGNEFWKYNDHISVSLEQVQSNFARYGLLDDRVKFLKGWFSDTLPTAPIEALAILRLDGDMYESTIDAIGSLYPKLSIGGFVIVDDYNFRECRTAIHDYRAAQSITDPMIAIDSYSIYWRRQQ
jgi:O-methyltransferase